MTKKEEKLFGTDGIRGVANRYPVTADVALSLGRAVASFYRGKAKRPDQKPLIIIGKDTRRSSYMLELALASGITSQGVNALLLGPMPTPGVSFLTKSMRADAGIMVSASHNSYEYNGIKIFGNDGSKISDEIQSKIEKYLNAEIVESELPAGSALGRAKRIDDVMGRYIVTVKSCLPKNFDFYGKKVVLDCANGAAYSCGPRVFEELGARVVAIGVDPNGTNINHQCGATHPERMRRKLLECRADLGIALDGDADRLIMCDEKGELLDGDDIIAILGIDRAKAGQLAQNKVVLTPMSNVALIKHFEKHGISVDQVAVGDRHIVKSMKENAYTLGGEPSGHIVMMKNASTGDGLMAALEVMATMKREGKSLSELRSSFKKYPQVLQNVQITKRADLDSLPEVKSSIERAKNELASDGRVFVRFSGTEPLCRVMVEGNDAQRIKEICETIALSVQAALG